MHTRRKLQVAMLAAVTACDDADTSTAHEAGAPLATTEIEVSEFEDHGVAIELRLATQYCRGRENRALSSTATASDDPLHIGDWGRARAWAGTFTDGAWSLKDGLSAYGAGDGDATGPTPQAPHVWTIDAVRLPSDRAGEYRIELTWAHLLRDRHDAAPLRTGDTRIVALGESERHVLDFMALPRDAAGCDSSVVIDVAAVPEEPPELAARRFHYEVWHVHTLPEGTEIANATAADAKHGASVEFALPELRPRLAEPLAHAGVEYELVLATSGSLRGRMRSDGEVDLLIEAGLHNAMVERGRPKVGGVAHRGSHAFRIAPGQTIRLELPPMSGTSSRVGGHAGDYVVDNAVALADHNDALLVTVMVD